MGASHGFVREGDAAATGYALDGDRESVADGQQEDLVRIVVSAVRTAERSGNCAIAVPADDETDKIALLASAERRRPVRCIAEVQLVAIVVAGVSGVRKASGLWFNPKTTT